MKHYLLNVWRIIDPIYYNFTKLEYVTDHRDNKTIFRVRLTKYKGSNIVLGDGTSILKNDLLLKIHLHNARMIRELKKANSEMNRAVLIYHMIRNDLQCLSRYVQTHNRHHDIKAIIGITMLCKGTGRLGFETAPIRNTCYRFLKKASFLPISFIANASSRNPPVYLFMSKNRLLNQFNHFG
ncbi:hypothetical protein GCM10008983_25550 [Lentibacillus halophilus]|uniref:YkoP-like domain-containing protein n=1 Tax=Lentibacillus halophilus TaxID=295065 RepID=A0ABN0ZG58_9BACI